MRKSGNLKAKRKSSLEQDQEVNMETKEVCIDLSFQSLYPLSSGSVGKACPERTIMPFCEGKAYADQRETRKGTIH